jgi:hypothetical protein
MFIYVHLHCIYLPLLSIYLLYTSSIPLLFFYTVTGNCSIFKPKLLTECYQIISNQVIPSQELWNNSYIGIKFVRIRILFLNFGMIPPILTINIPSINYSEVGRFPSLSAVNSMAHHGTILEAL